MSKRSARVHEFRQTLPDPRDVVFAWHQRPGGFARLAPPWQPTSIDQEAANLRDGTAVLKFPAGRKWVAQHLPEAYVEGRRFADELTSRPFLLPIAWHHQHEFEDDGTGTEVIDRVTTPLPDRLLAPMFAYRHQQLSDDLATHRGAADSPRLTVAVTGSSGLVGSALVPFLTTGGHKVVRLVRHAPTRADERQWNPQAPDPSILHGVDAVVHLAGSSIAGRFTSEHKRAIRSSRIEPTRLLALAAVEAGVGVFVSASAIGFYGADRGEELLDEGSTPGTGFLAEVVEDWEQSAWAASGSGTRVVMVRTGIVQSPRGGALKLQRPLYAAGLGGPLGSGEQWLSWIGIDDLVDVYHRALLDATVEGPVNAVAPQAVRQREWAQALGAAMHRPAILPTPLLGPRLLLGEEGEREVAAASQHVNPQALLEHGHTFRFTHIEPLLRHLMGSNRATDTASQEKQ